MRIAGSPAKEKAGRCMQTKSHTIHPESTKRAALSTSERLPPYSSKQTDMNHNQRVSSTDQRGRILQYALDEFKHNGIKNVKMDNIAEALSMSKRTLYEMFGDKENLLLESIKYHKGLTDTKIRKIYNKSKSVIETYVRIITMQYAEVKDINPLFITESYKYTTVKNFLEEIDNDRGERSMTFIQKGIEEGFFRPNLNYDFLICIQEIIRKAILQNKLYEKFTPEQIIGFFSETQIRGICTQKGIEELNRCWQLIKDDVSEIK